MADENEQELQQPVGGDDAPPTPVEVTLPEEGAEAIVTDAPAEGAEQQAPEPAPKPERLPAGVAGYDADGKPVYAKKAKQRIHELNTAWRNEKLRAEEAERRLAAAESEKAQLTARAQVVDKAAMDTHEMRWKTEEDLAAQQVAEARNAGNLEAEIAAQRRMNHAGSELQAIRAYKANVPAEPQQRQEQRQPQPGNGHAQPQQVQISPAMQAWVEQNPYLVGDSDEFDPEMSAHAQTAAQLLDGRFRRAGRAADIGNSEEYFTELTGMIQAEFPEYWEGQPTPQPSPRPQQRRAIPMTRQNGAGVAPASRTAQGPAGQPAANKITLTGDQKDMALRLAHNGALIYPAGHPQAGKRMNDSDAIVTYARRVQADNIEQAAKKG